MNPQKPNSTQIAKLAGVSRSTVSRVVNGYPNVPEATREKVMAAIQRYGYCPSISGQALRGKRMRCIGLFWGTYGRISYDSLASSFLIHVIESAADMGYLVLTSLPRDLRNPENQRAVREVFHSGRIDAGIFMGAEEDEPLIDELLDDGLWIGTFDKSLREGYERHFTVNMEPDTGRKMVQAAVNAGFRKLAWLDGDLHRLSCLERHESAMDAILDLGLEVRPEWMLAGHNSVDISRDGGYARTRALLQSGCELPEAICCTNDSNAFGAYQALREHGLRAGRDIAVIGADGHPMSGLQTPPLTTFAFDFRVMLMSLTQRLIRSLEGEEDLARAAVFTSEPVAGESLRRDARKGEDA